MSEDKMVITKRIQLVPLGDKEEVNRVYKFIREGMEAQNKAMNQYMSALYVATMMEASNDDKKELRGLYSRIYGSKKGSAYSEDIQFSTGLGTSSAVISTVSQDFSKSCKDGLLYGKVSLPTYKKTNPLLVQPMYVRLRRTNNKDFGLYHNYENHNEFLDNLHKKDLELFIKFANDITFKLILGSPHKSAPLRHEIQMIFEEYYTIRGSKIKIDDNGKIILYMGIEIPVKKHELDENVTVGVDLGIAIPAMCALNTNNYSRKSIGSVDDFTRVRTKIQAQRSRLQRSLKQTSGGHGRKKKLKPLDKFKDYERNWVQNYNHYVSKEVIDFALKNNAQYINLENLEGYGSDHKNEWILRNWSYCQLQEYITYKAEKNGIIVRKIDPYHTSQICSCCGHWEEGQRINQKEFICKSCGEKMNADFNAARNIAMSGNFSTKKKKKK